MVELPQISTFRTRLAAHLESSAEEMVDAISSAMFADLGPYQQLGGPGEVDRLRGNIRRILAAFRRMVVGTEPFPAVELSELHLTGGRRARQGIPLDVMTESVEIAMRVTWRFVRDAAPGLAGAGPTTTGPTNAADDADDADAVDDVADTTDDDADAARLADAAGAIADLAIETRDFMNEITEAMAAGYRMEREHGDAGRAQAVADLVDEILEARWTNLRRLRQAGRALGYEIAEPLTPALVATPDPAAALDVDATMRELAAALPTALVGRERTMSSSHIAVVVPHADGIDPAWVCTALANTPIARHAVVFVAEEASSLAALPDAYRALASELVAARVTANGPGVVSRRETELLRLLRGLALSTRLDFVREVIGPVLDLAPTRAREMVNTLHAYFRGRGRLDETAADLQLHRNSFRYRLDRAQTLLGISFRDPADRLKVEVALVLHELARHEAAMLDDPNPRARSATIG